MTTLGDNCLPLLPITNEYVDDRARRLAGVQYLGLLSKYNGNPRLENRRLRLLDIVPPGAATCMARNALRYICFSECTAFAASAESNRSKV